MPDFSCGKVYRTNRPFSGREDGRDAKPTWFICLGKTPIFESPLFLYVIRTTTQIDHFKPEGNRAGVPHVDFKMGECGFTEHCVAAIDDFIDNMTADAFSSLDPVEMGTLSETKAHSLYNMILASKKIMPRAKVLIHDGLGSIVSGLPMPKIRKR